MERMGKSMGRMPKMQGVERMTDVIIPRHYHAPWQDEFCEVCLNEGIRIGREQDLELLETAWGIIANVSEGNWEKQLQIWQDAAVRWRDKYHALLAGKERDLTKGESSGQNHELVVK